jgi:hypothetical protein
MIVDEVEPTARRTRAVSRAGAIGLAVCVVLITAAIAIPALIDWKVFVNSFPPLHAEWMPRVGPGTPAAIALLGLTLAFAHRIQTASWRRLMIVTFVLGLAWMLSLATVDGIDGIGVVLNTQYEYLNTARAVTDFGETLRIYIDRIPLDSDNNWPVHIAGHPPGALLFFVVLVHLGLASGLAAGLVVTVVAASTAVAVLQTVRRLGAETFARRAAPYLTIGPAAVWMSVSGDAVFAAFAAWGMLSLAIAATSQRRGRQVAWSLLAGALLGYCVMLSYGLPLLGVLAVTILVLTRSWRPLPWAVAAALAVVGMFALGGFAWWEAFPVLQDRYWDGIASRRPAGYWMWGNLAAVSISAGPWVGAAAGAAIASIPWSSWRAPLTGIDDHERARRTVAYLAIAGVAMCLLADVSQMSRAEVERIWLPFVPWMLIGAALLPERWRRIGLPVQGVVAITVQHLLATGW